jgi:glycopeptide antibiotics resistance protein
MWSYIELLTGNPNWKKDVTQNLQNILFFVPFGVLLPVKRWWTMFIIAALFSTWIEFIQYIGGFGLAELDDVICNTLGAIIGFKVWTWLKGKIDATGEKARNL